MGRPDEAAELLKKAIELDDGYSADSYNNLGLAYIDMQQFPEAEQAFRKSAEANIFFADAHLNLGTLYFQQANYAEAAKAFQQTLAIDPGVLKARSNLGITLLALGRIEAGVGYLEQVAKSDDESLRETAQKALDAVRKQLR